MSDLTPTPDDSTAERAYDLARSVSNTMQKASAAVDRIDTLSRQNDLLSGVVAHLMHKHGLTTVILGSFELECGPRVSIRPDAITKDSQDKHYYVELRPGMAGS